RNGFAGTLEKSVVAAHGVHVYEAKRRWKSCAARRTTGASKTARMTLRKSAPTRISSRPLSALEPATSTDGSRNHTACINNTGDALRACGIDGEGKNAPKAR